MWRTELAKALRRSFAQRKSKNPRYSLRAFAKHLGISATSLTDLLNDDGKWNISLKKAQPLVSKIGLSPLEENRLLVFMGETTYTKRSPLPETHVPLLNDWLYSAVLYAHQLPADQKTPESLAQRFAVPIERVSDVTEDLKTMKLLRPAQNGELVCSSENWTAAEPLSPATIRAHHRLKLEMAIHSIEQIPAAERDLSSLTFCGGLEEMNAVRREIRLCHEKIMAILSTSSHKTDVFQLSMALFPIRGDKTESTP